MRAPEPCPTCGASIELDHCGACGEMRPSARAYRLVDFAKEAFETLTNVERSLLRTLVALIRRPGELTAAYLRGERVRYLKPLQLFLLANVVYFLWAGFVDAHAFNTRLVSHLNASPFASHARAVLREKLPASGLDERAYVAAFDESSTMLARSLIIVMVPLFALAVAALRPSRRSPAVAHLVFALHGYTLVVLATIPVVHAVRLAHHVLRAAGVEFGERAMDVCSGLLMGSLLLAYFFASFRRAYGLGRTGAIVRSVLAVVAVVLVLHLYRFLLFEIVVHTL